MKIKVYGTPGCGYCDMTRAWLNDNNVSYEYVNLDDDDSKRSFYNEHAMTSVPQIFIDNKHIGGYNQMMSMRPQILTESRDEIHN